MTKVEDFWQENKRFVLGVAAGAAVFGIGWLATEKTLGADLRSQRARLSTIEKQLAQPRYVAADQTRAEAERERLSQAVATLNDAVSFHARPEFALDGTSPANRYFAVQSRVREELLTLAGRAGLVVPEGLGLPALSPTKEQEIVRYLEALDVVERVVKLAIDAGCERIDEIRIALDPRLVSGKSIPDIEKTSIEFDLIGASAPLARWIAATQQERFGDVLLIDKLNLLASRTKADESRLEVVFRVAHLYGDLEAGKEKP
ncbi:MAG: hypothetical protein HZA52_11570 [Planctomycetes bacterium]|nr:hypothetical protein [Planctomycetota bacterium]